MDESGRDRDDDAGARAARARAACPYLNTKQAAFHLGLSHRTLADMRIRGKGPRARRHGVTYRYHIDDLDRWSLGEANA
ncbi:helix-turn-helix domain-containing protein [Sphingomonas sp. UYEF23]|uniref:helix-turn-helix domain-containing protein n=1 Tax=Sphingomonas sp. UYEF23 TaxID=1756408 RepID=UPI00339947A4